MGVAELVSVIDKQPGLMTPAEVSKLLRVTVRTVNRWRASGRLRSVKTSPGKTGRVLIPKAAVLAMLAGSEPQRLGRTATALLAFIRKRGGVVTLSEVMQYGPSKCRTAKSARLYASQLVHSKAVGYYESPALSGRARVTLKVAV